MQQQQPRTTFGAFIAVLHYKSLRRCICVCVCVCVLAICILCSCNTLACAAWTAANQTIYRASGLIYATKAVKMRHSKAWAPPLPRILVYIARNIPYHCYYHYYNYTSIKKIYKNPNLAFLLQLSSQRHSKVVRSQFFPFFIYSSRLLSFYYYDFLYLLRGFVPMKKNQCSFIRNIANLENWRFFDGHRYGSAGNWMLMGSCYYPEIYRIKNYAFGPRRWIFEVLKACSWVGWNYQKMPWNVLERFFLVDF